MIFNRFYYFLLWIIIPSQAYCDTVWISRHFLPSDGLAYQVVRDIAQAPDGSLWFATWGGGLSHFNGSEWETLNEEKDISDFMTRTLTYDREGNLWVGTTEGIKKFDGKDWALYSIKNVPELKNDSIFTILPRSNGEIWFGMSEGYLYSYDPFKTYSSKWTQIQTPKFFNNRAIRNLIEMEDGSVWVGGYGIYHFDGTDWTQYSIGQRTYCFSKTNDGRILSAASESLFQFDGTKWSVIEEGGKEPRSVATTKDGTIVVGTTMGARICQDGVWSEFSLSKDSSYPYVEGVRCFEDGSIWIGSHNGVYFVRPSDWSYHSPPQFHHQIDGDRLIRSSQKSLRILTQKGEQYELSEGSWKPLQFHPEIEDTSLSAQSYNNNRFIVVTGQDVLEYDPEDLSVVRTVPLPPEMDLTNVYQTSDGALWIYGAEGEGLVYWTGEEWKPFKRKKQRVNERVHFIKETRDGTKWIVFNDAIEPIGKNYPFLDFFTDLRFRGHRITDICVTSDGSIWFATSGEGIVAFKDNRRIKYTSQNGLPNDWILCLYEAADGTIWAGMENSTVASFRDGRWVSFSKKEMFLEGHVTRISEDAEGAMWFVVEPSGLVRYVPSVNPPDTVIDVYPDAIVPKGMAIFSFHGWDAWHATPPNELVFSWRILDRRTQKERLPWTPFRTNVTVNSPPLYPGNYVFEVRAADKERNVDATPARVSFTVEPYFFTKTVFLAARLNVLAIRHRFSNYGISKTSRIAPERKMAFASPTNRPDRTLDRRLRAGSTHGFRGGVSHSGRIVERSQRLVQIFLTIRSSQRSKELAEDDSRNVNQLPTVSDGMSDRSPGRTNSSRSDSSGNRRQRFQHTASADGHHTRRYRKKAPGGKLSPRSKTRSGRRSGRRHRSRFQQSAHRYFWQPIAHQTVDRYERQDLSAPIGIRKSHATRSRSHPPVDRVLGEQRTRPYDLFGRRDCKRSRSIGDEPIKHSLSFRF